MKKKREKGTHLRVTKGTLRETRARGKKVPVFSWEMLILKHIFEEIYCFIKLNEIIYMQNTQDHVWPTVKHLPSSFLAFLQSQSLLWVQPDLQCGRPSFHPWVRKIPWRREWLPTPVFLPGESHGQRMSMGWSMVHGITKGQTGLSN